MEQEADTSAGSRRAAGISAHDVFSQLSLRISYPTGAPVLTADIFTIKIYKYRQTQQIYYTLPLPGYMFRLLRVIIRPSNELTQDYLILSALWDPVALTVVGAIVL